MVPEQESDQETELAPEQESGQSQEMVLAPEQEQDPEEELAPPPRELFVWNCRHFCEQHYRHQLRSKTKKKSIITGRRMTGKKIKASFETLTISVLVKKCSKTITAKSKEIKNKGTCTR